MKFLEMIIAFGVMLFAWLGAEVATRFGDHQDTYFAYTVDAWDDPIRPCIKMGEGHCADRIYAGTFEIMAHSIFDEEGQEWAIIRVSPFSSQEVFIQVDLTRMSTVWVQRNKIVSFGGDEIK